MSKVAVFGAGSWGTAFSVVLADAGNDVAMWARREELCTTINEKRENTDYLPGIDLPDAFRVLEEEGVDKFMKSWDELVETVKKQMEQEA